MATLVQALASTLAPNVSHAFGLMGNGNAHFIDALTKQGVALTEVRHEVATVASADAFVRITNTLAIATTTYGAGFTNTLTALAEAAQARTPLLLVVGDEPSTGRRPWDIDQEMVAAAIGVRTYTVTPENVYKIAAKAVKKALRHRKPVVVAIPYDLVNAEVADTEGVDLNDAETMASLARATMSSETVLSTPDVHKRSHFTHHDITRAAALLSEAQRPVVLAGHGAWISGAQQELDRMVSQLGALSASTALARGIFSDSARDLGLTGGFGQHEAMGVLATADVVLVVGAGLNQFTMRFGDLFGANTQVIRIDLDEVQAPKTLPAANHLLLRGDARDVLTALSDELQAQGYVSRGWPRLPSGLEPGGELRVLDTGVDNPSGLTTEGKLDPRAVAARLAELLPEDRFVASDGGHFIGWANMFWSVASPNRMVMVGTAFQSIGLGLASAPGAAVAAGESTLVVTSGDGGGLMAIADLESTIRVSNSCVIVIWNDGQYGAEVHLYGAMGLDETPMRIPTVNFAAIAAALGATGVRVETLDDLDALSAWRDAGAQGTILLDCRIDGSVVAPYQREIQRVNGVNN